MADKKVNWSDHEMLINLLNVIDKSNVKLDFNSVNYAPGRNASGFMQKIGKFKIACKAELDALNDGQPLPDAPAATPKKAAGRKRRTDDSNEADGEKPAPKKRGRAKKAVEQPEPEVDEEDFVKTESGEEIKAEEKEV